jgi:WD40 repeat protein
MEITTRWRRKIALLAFLSLTIIVSVQALIPQQPRVILLGSGRLHLSGFSPDGKTLAAVEHQADDFENPVLWDVASGLELSLFDKKRCIGPVQFSQDGNLVAVLQKTGESYSIVVFDLPTRREKISVSHPSLSDASSFCFLPNGNTLVFTTIELENLKTCLRFWDLKTGLEIFSRPGIGFPIAFSPDGEIMVSREEVEAGIKDHVVLRSVKTGEKLATINPSGGPVSKVEFSPDGKFLVTECRKDIGILDLLTFSRPYFPTVQLWEVATEGLVTTQKGCGDPVFLTDGKRLAVFSFDGTWQRFQILAIPVEKQLREKEVLGIRQSNGFWIPIPGSNLVASYKRIGPSLFMKWIGRYFSPPNNHAWVSDVELKDLRTGRHEAHIVQAQAVGQLRVSPDGKAIATEAYEGETATIQLWHVPPRKPLWWTISLLAVPVFVTLVVTWKLLAKRRSSRAEA